MGVVNKPNKNHIPPACGAHTSTTTSRATTSCRVPSAHNVPHIIVSSFGFLFLTCSERWICWRGSTILWTIVLHNSLGLQTSVPTGRILLVFDENFYITLIMYIINVIFAPDPCLAQNTFNIFNLNLSFIHFGREACQTFERKLSFKVTIVIYGEREREREIGIQIEGVGGSDSFYLNTNLFSCISLSEVQVEIQRRREEVIVSSITMIMRGRSSLSL